MVIGAAFVVNHYFPMGYSELVFYFAERFNIEPELVFAVIHAESGFYQNAVSISGASGLMQIMEPTAYWLAPQAGLHDFSYENIFCPETNILLGSFYLSMLINRFDNIEVALSAYNAGSGNVSSWLDNPDYSEDGFLLDHIPFPETREYVRRVMRNHQIYSNILRVTGIFR
jgi:soluble lytic murein transglycosylase